MPSPACAKCKRFYRPLKNGVVVNEQAPICNGALPGLTHEVLWHPYKIWNADLWRCEGCGHELISGWSNKSTVRYESSFVMELNRVTHLINDC